jgi:Uma2 family endonuclease
LPVPKAGKDSTVVQPDICIICDLSKLDERGCNGAPDLVVEIVSPSNSKYDLVTKFELYQDSGVKEYWIIQPESKTILIYSLQNGRYIGLPPLTEGQKINSPLFPMIDFEVEGVFE